MAKKKETTQQQPNKGGSYTRNKETGELTPAKTKATENKEP